MDISGLIVCYKIKNVIKNISSLNKMIPKEKRILISTAVTIDGKRTGKYNCLSLVWNCLLLWSYLQVMKNIFPKYMMFLSVFFLYLDM